MNFRLWICALSFLISCGYDLQAALGPIKALGIEIEPSNLSCHGAKDGSIRLALINGFYPISYQWNGVGVGGNGVLTNVNPVIVLNDLSAGSYVFSLTDAAGADTVVLTQIAEPDPLFGYTEVLSDYAGFEVSCFDAADGVANVKVFGGTPNYQFAWSNGAFGQLVDNLANGLQAVTVTDANLCVMVLSVNLDAPPPISVQLSAEGDKCLGQDAGEIDISSIGGGVPPYSTIFNGQPPGTDTHWDSLPSGFYFLAVQDANGCLKDEGIVLPEGVEFMLSVGADTAIFSGDTVWYKLQANRTLTDVQWTPAEYTYVPDFQHSALFPFFSTTYQVEAVDDIGCLARDEVTITVHRNRMVFIPNVFAPQAEAAENRTLTVFTGGGVSEITTFRVFDRFGRLWFEKNKFAANDPDQGWDGRSENVEAAPGVYLYQVVVALTDGRKETYFGDVTLIR